MKLSKLSLLLAAYIVISAFFAQQVLAAWKTFLGANTLILLFALLCLLILSAVIIRSVKSGLSAGGIALVFIVFVSGFVFAWRQPYLSEKAHVLEYGALAWLSLRDLSKGGRNIIQSSLIAFIFASTIGILDEGFQKLLPWRVSELRDIATNIISAIFGIYLFNISKR